LKVISKFAQMEFKFGEAERGRTIFESILSNYPKRTDLWSVYLDMELRDIQDAQIPRYLLFHYLIFSLGLIFYFFILEIYLND